MSANVPNIFDRAALRRNRTRAAAQLHEFDFLLQRAAEDLLDRIKVQNRKFETALCLGASNGYLGTKLKAEGLIGSHSTAQINTWIEADITAAMLPEGGLVLDEEHLPIKPQSVDLIVSFWGLHHVNDLPGALVQICRALKPDGVFLAALPGNENLRALQTAFLESQTKILGGVRPHIHPFADLRDLAGLMQRAGFDLPVADSDILRVRYAQPMSVFRDLRGMGESNVLTTRTKSALRRDVLQEALARFHETTQDNGKAVAEFEICYLAGVSPLSAHSKKHEPGEPITRFDERPITGDATPNKAST
ncbi:MAG: methyltransferase domain-containing protein [Rhodobiaceae bacterium]|jgi:NADH dehydrogenase [ubiquinone] 1 alpha subcomplex assembly factor 5|nr:methyltransferase domain-containing protein [Rhodobiaceae bacterium]